MAGKKKTNEEYIKEVAKINPYIEVIDKYINSSTKIWHRCKVDENVFKTTPSEVLRGQGCPKCARKRIIAAHTKTHDWYISEIQRRNLNIIPIEKYIKNKIKIKHMCQICGHQWNVSPNDILHGYGCPVCAHKVIGNAPEYRNSIWASKYKELAISYGMTEEQMKTIMPMSNRKIIITCQKCGAKKNIAPDELFQRGFKCPICSDGISFPNKFMYSLFNQLHINFKPEYCEQWTNGYKYDIFNKEFCLIVENHGIQHYEEVNFSKSDKTTLKERQAIDITKENLANNNGIKHYIILDCRYSDAEWIKKSVMNSALPKILNFTENDIDWNKCTKDASSSLVKASALLWSNGLTIREISNQLKLSDVTIKKYLKIANKIGFCNYTSGDGMKRYHENKLKNRSVA